MIHLIAIVPKVDGTAAGGARASLGAPEPRWGRQSLAGAVKIKMKNWLSVWVEWGSTVVWGGGKISPQMADFT